MSELVCLGWGGAPVTWHRGKAGRGHTGKSAVCKPRREPSGEASPAPASTLDFQALDLREEGFLSLKLSGLRYLSWQPEPPNARSKASDSQISRRGALDSAFSVCPSGGGDVQANLSPRLRSLPNSRFLGGGNR